MEPVMNASLLKTANGWKRAGTWHQSDAIPAWHRSTVLLTSSVVKRARKLYTQTSKDSEENLEPSRWTNRPLATAPLSTVPDLSWLSEDWLATTPSRTRLSKSILPTNNRCLVGNWIKVSMPRFKNAFNPKSPLEASFNLVLVTNVIAHTLHLKNSFIVTCFKDVLK